jgi:hypothetical protein
MVEQFGGKGAMIDGQWNHTTAKWVREGDLVRAEQARRVAAPEKAKTGRCSAAMARLGQALANLGAHLQERYSAPPALTKEQPGPAKYRQNALTTPPHQV